MMGLHQSLTFVWFLFGMSIFQVIAQDDDNAIVVASRRSYYGTNAKLYSFPGNAAQLEDSSVSQEELDLETTDIVTEMSCFSQEKDIYFVELEQRSILKLSNFDPKWAQNVTLTLVHPGISDTASNIAIDWLARNLYWTDHQFGWIGVQPLNAANFSMYKILIHERTLPLGIAVEALEGHLFWFDMLGLNPAILRADLSGQNQRTIVHSSLQYVESMHVDYKEKRLYWLDYTLQKLESVNYFGTDRRATFRLSGYGLSKFVISGKSVCALDTTYDDLECFDKISANSGFYDYFYDYPLAITNCDKNEYPSGQADLCQTLGCQHICVRVNKTASKCLCQEGYTLQSDEKSCNADHGFYNKGILLSNSTDICMVEIRAITGAIFETIRFPGNFSNTRHLAADANTYNVYYYNETSSEIWEYNLQTNVSRSVVSTGNITDLEHDHLGQNLIWAESNTGKIKMFDLMNRMDSTLVSGISNLGSITVGPHEASVFWIESNENDEYKIMSADLDGSDKRVIVDSKNLTKPTALFYEGGPNRVFYLDNSALTAIRLNGSNPVKYKTYAEGTDLLIYGRYSLWIDSYSGILYATSYMAYSQHSPIHKEEFGRAHGIAIFDAQKQLADRGPCWTNNGGCEGICVPFPNNTRECRCDFGLKLDTDGTSCTSKPLTTNFLLVVDTVHEKIFEIDMDNPSNIVQFEIPKADAVTQVVHHYEEDRLYMVVPDERQIISVKTDGSNLTVEVSTGQSIPRHIAVDYSSGIVYFTYEAYETSYYTSGYVSVYDRTRRTVHSLFSGLEVPGGIELDPADGKMFVLDAYRYWPRIYVAPMDGSTSDVLVGTGLKYPNSITADAEENKLYWTDSRTDLIGYINYDGTGQSEIKIEEKWIGFSSIVFKDKYMYAVGKNVDKIYRMDKVTRNFDNFMDAAAEFGSLSFVTVVPREKQSVSVLCADNNGECSSFCLPASANSRLCACKDGDVLLEDNLSCSADRAVCSKQILHGKIIPSTTCFSIEGNDCEVFCEKDYRLNTVLSNNTVKCKSDGNWTLNENEICEKIKCPATFPHGNVINCNNEIGVYCSYNCSEGYVPNSYIGALSCTSTGQWNHMHGDICIAEGRCESPVPNGMLVGKCIVGPVGCEYSCNENFVKNSAIKSVHCRSDKTFSVDPQQMCVALQCAKDIPSGSLSPTCQPNVGAHCTYSCDKFYEATQSSIACLKSSSSYEAAWSLSLDSMCKKKECVFNSTNAILLKNQQDAVYAGEPYSYYCENLSKNPAVDKVICSADGHWNVLVDSLCIALQCPKHIPFGSLSPTCQPNVGAHCTYSCDKFYEATQSSIACLKSSSLYEVVWSLSLDSMCKNTTKTSSVSLLLQDKTVTGGLGTGGSFGIGVVVTLAVVVLVAFGVYMYIYRKRHQNAMFVNSSNIQYRSNEGILGDRASGISNPMPYNPEESPISSEALNQQIEIEAPEKKMGYSKF